MACTPRILGPTATCFMAESSPGFPESPQMDERGRWGRRGLLWGSRRGEAYGGKPRALFFSCVQLRSVEKNRSVH